MKLFSSLFSKILLWFFMNLALVTSVLVVFFAFQSQIDLHSIFGQQASDRLRTAGRLISHELNQLPTTNWSGVLTRHAEIHQVDFVLILKGGFQSLSKDMDIPESVLNKAMAALRPPPKGDLSMLSKDRKKPGKKRRFVMQTKNPTRYWAGIRIRMPRTPLQRPTRAVLISVSESITGNGFFFDPLPLIIVAAAVMLISVLLWIPLVRNITRPLARMTHAAEEIAKGKFDVLINEPRADEIGRLGSSINHMTSRLSGFVRGQKRFLGDVAHELGSPISRIQMGLGIIEHQADETNRTQVADVMEDVTHMSNLVNELLSFSRAEMETAKVKLETIEVLSIVQRAVQRENTPTTEIISQIDPKTRVIADSQLLARALANIIRNAVKYAGNAGPIYISAKNEGNKIAIKIKDSGPGVPDDLVKHIFEPFFRPEPSRDRGSGGVGLGLAIVKTCIETCKGTVSAQNLKPKGFAITITLTSGA